MSVATARTANQLSPPWFVVCTTAISNVFSDDGYLRINDKLERGC